MNFFWLFKIVPMLKVTFWTQETKAYQAKSKIYDPPY